LIVLWCPPSGKMLMDGSLINMGLHQGVTVAAVSHLKVLVAPLYCAES